METSRDELDEATIRAKIKKSGVPRLDKKYLDFFLKYNF